MGTRVRSVYQVLCYQGLDVQNHGGFFIGVLPKLGRQDKSSHFEKVRSGSWGWQLGKKGNTANMADTGCAGVGGREAPGTVCNRVVCSPVSAAPKMMGTN